MQTGASQPLSLNPTGTLSRRYTAHFVSAIDTLTISTHARAVAKKASPALRFVQAINGNGIQLAVCSLLHIEDLGEQGVSFLIL